MRCRSDAGVRNSTDRHFPSQRPVQGFCMQMHSTASPCSATLHACVPQAQTQATRRLHAPSHAKPDLGMTPQRMSGFRQNSTPMAVSYYDARPAAWLQLQDIPQIRLCSTVDQDHCLRLQPDPICEPANIYTPTSAVHLQ